MSNPNPPSPPVPPNDNVPYPPDPAGRREADGRPLPGRPATKADHHDHRHFPFTTAQAARGECPICESDKQNKIPFVHPNPNDFLPPGRP